MFQLTLFTGVSPRSSRWGSSRAFHGRSGSSQYRLRLQRRLLYRLQRNGDRRAYACELLYFRGRHNRRGLHLARYSSSSYSFDIASVDSPILAGGLNADGSLNSFGALEILAPTDFPNFGAFNGFFNVANEAETFNLGSAYTFTLVSGAVPEPSTWTMMVLGFAGLGYAGYRKARQAAFASA